MQCVRDDDLLRNTHALYARGNVHHVAEDVVRLHDTGAIIQSDTDGDAVLFRLLQTVRINSLLHPDGAFDRFGAVFEAGHHGVTDGLDDLAAVLAHDLADAIVASRHHHQAGSIAVPLEVRCGAFDVSEKDGDIAAVSFQLGSCGRLISDRTQQLTDGRFFLICDHQYCCGSVISSILNLLTRADLGRSTEKCLVFSVLKWRRSIRFRQFTVYCRLAPYHLNPPAAKVFSY